MDNDYFTNYYSNINIKRSFPEENKDILSFKQEYENIYRLLKYEFKKFQSHEDNEINKYIDNCIDGIRMMRIPEEIEFMISKELDEKSDKYLDFIKPEILEKILISKKRFKNCNKRSSRFAGKISSIPSNIRTIEEIINDRDINNVLNSYLLTRTCSNVRLRRQFVGMNSIIYSHEMSKTKLENRNDKQKLKKVNKDCLIITVSFYHPIRGMKMAEFDVLEYQTLAEIRDAFNCDDSKREEELLKVKTKGACFFIDGVLYPDLRESEDGIINYATYLKGYCNTVNTIDNKEEIIPMHKCKLNEISIPINLPCSFLHSGDCEHRFTFTNIRVYQECVDCPYEDVYPLQIYSPSTILTFCEICGINLANKLIFNALNLPKNPSYLCDSCTFAFLYDKETKNPLENFIICNINSKLPNSNGCNTNFSLETQK
ncbi:hypothetical protein ACR3K2_22360 [Cryptosporidium serpentis]